MAREGKNFTPFLPLSQPFTPMDFSWISTREQCRLTKCATTPGKLEDGKVRSGGLPHSHPVSGNLAFGFRHSFVLGFFRALVILAIRTRGQCELVTAFPKVDQHIADDLAGFAEGNHQLGQFPRFRTAIRLLKEAQFIE